jgi:NADH-quinone oxidoreductase subunit A
MPQLVGYLLLFLVVGVLFIFVHLMMGKLIRPAKPNTEKLTIYECGEPTIGSAWIQFDVRFYVVALLFVIFDVEVAFFFPWAVVFGKANALSNWRLDAAQRTQLSRELVPPPTESPLAARPAAQPVPQAPGAAADVQPEPASRLAWLAFWDIMVFFGVLLVGFAYLWRRGDLDWVRSTAAERLPAPGAEAAPPAMEEPGVLVGTGGRP